MQLPITGSKLSNHGALHYRCCRPEVCIPPRRRTADKLGILPHGLSRPVFWLSTNNVCMWFFVLLQRWQLSISGTYVNTALMELAEMSFLDTPLVADACE